MKRYLKLVSTVFFVFYLLSSTGMSQNVDSVDYRKGDSDMFGRNQVVSLALKQLPFALGGTLAYIEGGDMRFKAIRDNYVPDFHYTYDNYLQYFPAFALVCMKSLNVEGRSTWGEMLVADAFSVAITSALSNSLKVIVGRTRPDSYATNSFPSGHTAVAFMTATMLHYEYGHLSPLVSLSAYATATAVGVSRVLNDRHWVSDVAFGAGIGVLSTQIGYLISDAIFNKKPLLEEKSYYTVDDDYSFMLGLDISLDGFLNKGWGNSVEINGVYLLDDWGICLDAFVKHIDYEYNIGNEGVNAFNDYIGCRVGVEYGYRPIEQLKICGKVRAGAAVMSEDVRFVLNTGVYALYNVRANYGFKVFVDYGMMPFSKRYSNRYDSGALSLGVGYVFCI